MVRKRRENKMKLLRPSSVAGLLLPGLATTALCPFKGVSGQHEQQNNQLRRKRVELPKAPLNNILDSDRDLEDMWEKASRTAKSEIEIMRLLNMRSPDMSMGGPSGVGPPARPPAVMPSSPPVTGPTPSPVDCLMGRTKAEYIFDLLSPLTPAAVLNDMTTPQGMAFDYLVNNDPGLQDPCSSTTIQQRYGLTTLYYSTQGGSWTTNSGWLGTGQECSWFGIQCPSGTNVATQLSLRKSSATHNVCV